MSQNNSISFASEFSYYFNISIGGFLTFFGLIGNMIVLCIFCRKSFRKIAMFRYCSFLVASETIQLLMFWPFNFPDTFLINENQISCKMIEYFSYTIGNFDTWMVIVISLDRFISVKYPHDFRFRKSFNFQITILAVLLLISMMINVPFYLFDSIYTIENQTFCDYHENPNVGIIIDFSSLVVSLLFPFIVSLTLSCLTGYNLIKKKRILNSLKFSKEIRLLKILISMDLFFFICYFPWCLYTILSDALGLQSIYPVSMNYFYDLANFMFYVYQSCSFVVYICSNKKFKEYFLLQVRFKSHNNEH